MLRPVMLSALALPLGLALPYATARAAPGFEAVRRPVQVLKFDGDVPRNILFLSIDTLRRDHVGPYSTLGLTPFFDVLASESVVLHDHYQCSNWTYDSTTCTLAGRSHIDRGHIPRLTRPTRVPDDTPFLATWLGDAGFYNIIVSSNSWMSASWGNTQGYHEEYGGGDHAELLMRDAKNRMLTAIGRGDTPNGWFLHAHIFDPHPAYDPAPEYVEGIDELNPWPTDLTNRSIHYGESDNWPWLEPKRKLLLEAHLRRLYEGEVREVDARMAAGFADMDRVGLLDDTLVVIWNDHGEQFFEHGRQTHAWQLHPEENAGILMFWAKNIIPGTWNEPTTTLDLVPTLLDLHGIPIPPEVTGIPLGAAPPDRPLFTAALARNGPENAVIKDDHKLIFVWQSGTVEYYDRSVDPGEKNDLYDPAAIDPKVLELWALLRPKVEAMDALVSDYTPSYPPELP